MISKSTIRAVPGLDALDEHQLSQVQQLFETHTDKITQTYDEYLAEGLGVTRPPEADKYDFWKTAILEYRDKQRLVAPLHLDVQLVDVRAADPRTRTGAMRVIKETLAANNIAPNDPRHQQIIDKTWREVVDKMDLAFT